MEQDEAREPVPSHDAFISYSRRDKEFARRLGDALRSYKPPRDLNVAQRHLDVFRDEEDFTGVEYRSSVGRHLKSSNKLLLLCSPNSRASEYVDDEIRRFAASHGADSIIPILVSGTPNNEAAPGQEDRMAFPDALCKLLEMPLAVDYRGFDPKRDKVDRGRFRGPWYTVLANIYGASRSLIEQREKKREARRRRIAIGIAGIVMAALVAALFSWRQTVEERKVAAARQLSNRAEIVRNTQPANLELSALLAVESMKRVPSLEADLVLRPEVGLLPRLLASISHDEAYRVAFSPDGKLVATVTIREVRISELRTGREIARLAPLNPVGRAVFSPDGKHLATASGSSDPSHPRNYAAQMWELGPKPREVSRMPHDEPVENAAFSPDGKYLATIGESNAHLWEAATGRELAKLPHEATVLTLAFSPDGQRLATGTNRGAARMWSVPAGREVLRVTQEGIVSHIVFYPDGTWWMTEGAMRDAASGRERFRLPSGALELHPSWDYAAAADGRGTVRIWEISMDGVEGEEAVMTHRGTGRALVFSPDGEHIATAGDDDTVRIWTLDGREVTRLRHDHVTSVAFSPDGRYLATVSHGMVRYWELTAGREVALIPDEEEMFVAEFSADGKYLWTGSGVWEMPSGRKAAAVPDGKDAGAVALSRDGKYLAVAGGEEVHLAESLTGRRVAPLQGAGNVSDLVFSPDGRHLATAGLDHQARVWEVPSGREVARMPHSDGLNGLAFSPDGKRLATATINTNTVLIWDSITGKELLRLSSRGTPGSLTFSPDGRYLAAAVFDTGGGASVWESTTGKEVAHVAGGMGTMAVAFSPDGKHLATGGLDAEARLWTLDRSEKEVSRMPHRAEISALAFAADGTYLVTASVDGTARLWEAISGRELARMQHPAPVMAMGLSPDERYVATASLDSRARIWYLRPDDLIAEACRRLTRNLTRDEWRQYVGDEPYSPTCPGLPAESRRTRGAAGASNGETVAWRIRLEARLEGGGHQAGVVVCVYETHEPCVG